MLDGSSIEPVDMGLVSAPAREIIDQPLLQFPIGTRLEVMELEAIRRTLEYTGGDKAKAAELLGINQRTIYRKLPEL
jgi:transcriptional regulator with PAS, ATPase and Fis domain